MEFTQIALYITYAILVGLVLFAGIVFLKVYKPKPKVKKEKTKKQSDDTPKAQPKVKRKGRKEILVSDEGDVISLGGSVSETEPK